MRFVVHAADGSTRESVGSNIVPAFPAGTMLTGYSINGIKFKSDKPYPADGEPMVFDFKKIRETRARNPQAFKPTMLEVCRKAAADRAAIAMTPEGAA